MSKPISRSHLASEFFRELQAFGYSTLTLSAVEQMVNDAIAGKPPTSGPASFVDGWIKELTEKGATYEQA